MTIDLGNFNDQIEEEWLIGKFKRQRASSHLKMFFEGGLDSYQVLYKLPAAVRAEGLLVSFKLEDWDYIKYIAIGVSQGSEFNHVKIENPTQSIQVPIDLHFDSLAWKINNYSRPFDINDIRIYIKGKPKHGGAQLALAEIGYIISNKNSSAAPELMLSDACSGRIGRYLQHVFPNFEQQAEQYFSDGLCPLLNDVCLEWDIFTSCPVNISSNNTLRYSWFALHPVIILLLDYYKNSNLKSLDAAHDIFLSWYHDSFLRKERDKKYNWYDHGVSERQLALMLLHKALKQSSIDEADSKRIKRIESIIFQQAELLASEVFYCRDQVDRYHNHGCFQDLALVLSANMLPISAKRNFWNVLAITRMEDQIDKIVFRQHQYAISMENSLGYQYILFKILEMFTEILLEHKKFSILNKITEELKNFICLFKLPDGQLPSFGDTYKGHQDRISPKPFSPGVFEFIEAGYIVIKQYYEDIEFNFNFYATSLGNVHKHHDNLSFILNFDGVDWFNDPSFYSHEYADELPRFLRSEFAHNNLIVPGETYHIGKGRAQILDSKSWNKIHKVVGQHSCYEGIRITRELVFDAQNCSLLITDNSIDEHNDSSAKAVLVYQFGIGVSAIVSDNKLTLSHPESNYLIQLEVSNNDINVVKGWLPERKFNGISGRKFLMSTETYCAYVPLQVGQDINTRITIRKKSG